MAQLSQLLLFDPDPSGLDTLTYGFEKEGCSVTATADAAKARDLILGANPALLVINLRDSEQVGLDLLKATTSNPRSRNLACVAIGREDFRPAVMAAGAFVFLSTPLFVRDVLGACRLVAAASVPGSRPSPDRELSLTLAELDGMYFLVRALAVTGRSAVIEVQRAPKHGELRFMDGTLTSVEMGALQGLPALHQMLLWEDAGLHFKFKNVVRRGTQLSMKSSEVIEECDRFLRDFAHEVKDLGFSRTIYSAGAGAVQPSSDLPSELVPVLRLFDGQRTLGQVLDDSPFRVFDTLNIIKRFVAAEAIRANTVVSPPGREGGPNLSGPGALDYWLQRQAPVLGAELGTGTTAAPATVAGKRPVDGIRRPSMGGIAGTGGLGVGVGVGVRPVAGNAPRPSSPFISVSGEQSSSEKQAVPGLRTRTITQKDHLVEVSAGLSPEDIPTPPPVVKAVDPSPKAAVATGEIKIKVAVSSARQPESVPAEGAPSVLVEIGPIPVPMSMGSDAPVPVTANSGSPSVIIAPMTPAPVATGRQRKFTPTPGADGKRNNRSPSDSFNAVESDFFEREADLYKPESVEDFGDLDGKSRTAHRPNGPSRKR